MVQALQLKISGMTCAACAAASERAVKKLPGVAEAAVNFSSGTRIDFINNGVVVGYIDATGTHEGTP